MQFHFLAAMSLVAATASAQLPFDRTIVATRLTGTAAQTQLLAIDAQGVVTPFPRFPSDVHPPLAIEYDPIDGHILLAIAISSTTSRVLRLIPAGISIQRELALGDITGPVTQLAAVADYVYASVGGVTGGLYRFERRRCCASQIIFRPNTEAMFIAGQQHSGILAWSPAITPPAPGGRGFYDFVTFQPTSGPSSFGSFAPAVNGVTDLPLVGQQLLSFTDGTIAVFIPIFPPPMPILLAPQPPAGGAVAMKSPGPAFDAFGLGGAPYPFLYHIDPNLGVVTVLAGPLPGAPVDFALALPRVAQTLPFSIPCGTPALTIGSSGGVPSLGNAQFRIDLTGGAASQGCLFVAGFDDETVFGGPILPQPLPGLCPLHVEPLVVNFRVTNASGAASQPLAVPNLPQLNGTFVFAQWLQLPGTAFIGSQGLSVQIGP